MSSKMDSNLHSSAPWSCSNFRHFGLWSYGRLDRSFQDLDFWPFFHFSDRPFGRMQFYKVGLKHKTMKLIMTWGEKSWIPSGAIVKKFHKLNTLIQCILNSVIRMVSLGLIWYLFCPPTVYYNYFAITRVEFCKFRNFL